MSNVNKVDMSLDDIIKLNKKQRGQGQGRGRLGRGLGRGGKANKIKQFRTSLRGGTRGQGRGGQGRGGRGGRGRLRRLSSGVSPLNRPQDQSSVATSPNKQGQGQLKQSLKQQRLKAVFALRKAKQQLARIDAQATRRQDVVNQRRGLQQQTSQQQHYQYQNSNLGRGRGRGGRGRGRGRLGRQNQRQQNQINVASYGYNQTFTQTRGRGRGRLRRLGQNYNSSLSLNSSTMSTGSVNTGNTGNRKKRQWRRRPVQPPVSQNDGILTISLPNSDYQPSPKQQQAAANKKYNYNKRLFAESGTNASLSERFNQGSSETGRQVFL